ncbi:hypothetical protein J2S34_003582 [Nitrobacter winogradskyi]|uniref:Uncharacterized protein n=1 Tax=Nitrobacter winogradskyi TaxID=913 RepID=A0ACC6ANA3_NITWI|nr:hypothetical protein [Nitrobacter winogradskyi]MCP2001096.1 hypothetical protein [Nitrobacter winogradskyi]
MEFLPIHGGENTAVFREAARGRDLMIVAMLTKICTARHHDDPLAEFEGDDDRPHSGMSDDKVGDFDMLFEFVGAHKRCGADVPGTKVGGTDLGKDVGTAAHARPFVDRPDQTIERPLGAHGNKNHNTEPT